MMKKEFLHIEKENKSFPSTEVTKNQIITPKKNRKGICDWLGNIYKGEVFDKKWRNKFFWAIYTDKQVESLVSLLKQICEDFNIKRDFIGHNVKVSGVQNFKGVVNRSNYSDCFTDLSPAFNFEKIKEIL